MAGDTECPRGKPINPTIFFIVTEYNTVEKALKVGYNLIAFRGGQNARSIYN
jgi:hypothetical protein